MIHFKRSDEFQEWLYSLRSKPVHGRVLTRLDNARMGNFGDCENVGNGVSEMRIHYGPGYRVYFKRIGEVVYLLLIGGDKSTQKRDIERAKEIAEEFEKKECPMTQFKDFDIAEHLTTPEDMAEYLEASFEEDSGDGLLIRSALNNIARAQGMTQIARDAGLGRESLYKALSSTGNPEFATIMKVMKALGLKLHATAI